MKNLVSFSLRCVDAMLWSLGLTSIVMLLMLGFYLCWTKPLTKTFTPDLASKPVKTQPETKASFVLDKQSIFAGR